MTMYSRAHALRGAQTLLLLLAILLTAASCAKTDPLWRDTLASYRGEGSVQELLLVHYEEGTQARVSYYQKQGSRARWVCLEKTDAWIGKNGVGKTREGDAKTPVGDFGVVSAFGVSPDPGTTLPWISVTPATFACDEDGPWYNCIIDTVATHHRCKGEDMFRTVPEYNYGLALDYNAARHYPDGSAIFLHCKGAKTYTGGCVAVDEAFLRTVLTSCHPGLRVVIR